MRTEQAYFESAKPLARYMEEMSTKKEESFEVYNSFDVPADDEFIEILKMKSPHILVITEDWCGDAMMNNAILRKIAEAADIEVRAVLRDENLELMDQYLTNGGRSIPMYLLLSDNGEVLAQWGPRADSVQSFVMEGRATLPEKENAAFEEAQKKFYDNLMHEFVKNKEFHLAVYESIRNSWIQVLQK